MILYDGQGSSYFALVGVFAAELPN
jgi:hypothetical protein